MAPLHSFQWGAESIYTCKFSPVECNIMAASSSDCAVVLYDVRARTPIKKVPLNLPFFNYFSSIFSLPPLFPYLLSLCPNLLLLLLLFHLRSSNYTARLAASHR
jgi:hypothetical protein